MGANAKQVGAQIWKFLVESTKTCHKLVGAHLALFAMVCFFFLLQRTFPLLFSLFLYASPILVCTAGLLGALLTFGKLDMPATEEKKEAKCHFHSGSKASKDATASENQYNLNKAESHKVGDSNFPEYSANCSKEYHIYSSTNKGKYWNADEGYLEEEAGDGDDTEREGSSSPATSVAEIFPLLDELHPLLDLEAPHTAPISCDGSDASSEWSNKSNRCILESDMEINGEDTNDDEEEEAQEGRDNASSYAISWTADDQKNLMDLGSSELERNRRLESLLIRRRKRKTMSLVPDLENAGLPFHTPPISTEKQNPFVTYNDSPDDLGLPPISGSAPSTSVPKKNPFDLPYNSSDNKHDPKRDGFGQDFTTFTQKESEFFRKHERRHRLDARMRPIFVPERFSFEGTSYNSVYRQLSELSYSKMSSVLDTDSSVVEPDDKKIKEDVFQESEFTPNVFFTSDHSEHGSQFSKDIGSPNIEKIEKEGVHRAESEITLGYAEDHQELEPKVSKIQEVATTVDTHEDESHQKQKPLEDYGGTNSKSLSEDEEIEKVPNMMEEEGSANIDPKGEHSKETGIARQPSLGESYFDSDNQYKEPIYDTSPRGFDKFYSFRYISYDLAAELYEESSEYKTAGYNSESSEYQDASDLDDGKEVGQSLDNQDGFSMQNGHVMSDPSLPFSENGLKGKGLGHQEESQADAAAHKNQMPFEEKPSLQVEHVEAYHPNSSSSENEPTEEHKMDKNDNVHQDQDRASPSTSSGDGAIEGNVTHDGKHILHEKEGIHLVNAGSQEFGENLSSKVTVLAKASNASATLEQQSPLIAENAPNTNPIACSEFDSKNVKENPKGKDGVLLSQQDQVYLSSSDTKTEKADACQDSNLEVASNSSPQQLQHEEKSVIDSEKQLSCSDKTMDKPSFDGKQPSSSDKTVDKPSSDEKQLSNSVKNVKNSSSEELQPSHSDKSVDKSSSDEKQPSYSDKTVDQPSSDEKQLPNSDKTIENPSSEELQPSHSHKTVDKPSSDEKQLPNSDKTVETPSSEELQPSHSEETLDKSYSDEKQASHSDKPSSDEKHLSNSDKTLETPSSEELQPSHSYKPVENSSSDEKQPSHSDKPSLDDTVNEPSSDDKDNTQAPWFRKFW